MKRFFLNLLLLLITANSAHAMPKAALADALIKLDVTAEQKAQIASILKAARSEVRPKVDAMIVARKNLRAAITQDQYSEPQIRAASKEVAKLQEDLAVRRAGVRAQVMQVLTIEQRKTATQLQADFGKGAKNKLLGFRKLLNHWVDKNAKG